MAASILYCGHSTLIITSESGKRIAVDPYLENNPRCPKELYDPGHLDAIVLTHAHSDHVGSTIQLAKKYGSIIFAMFELTSLLKKDGVDASQLQGMNKGGTVALPDQTEIQVSLTNAFHSSAYTAKDGTSHYAGEAAGAVIRLESGKTIFHAGDTSLFSDLRLIGEQFSPEIAFLPIGDRFTMGPKEAAIAASLVKPKIAVPIHYATSPMLTGTAAEFLTHLSGTEVKGVEMHPGGTMEI